MLPYFYFPTLNLGPISINTWGFFVSLGFAAAIWIAYKRTRSKVIVDMAFWIIIASLIGARLGHVFFYEWGYFSQHFWEIVQIDQGGLSSFGGFIGAGAVFWVYKRKLTLHILDAIMFAFPLGWTIGRVGCFLIHDHPGKLTSFFLGVNYPGGARHDLGLYESINGLALFLALVVFSRFLTKRDGLLTAFGCVWYGIVRFFLDFLRVGDTTYFGLTPGQYGSIALVVVGAYLWYNIENKLKI